jgi:ABC-2 type transport system permease protein
VNGRIGPIARHGLRLLRREPTYAISMTAMPILVIGFLHGTLDAALAAEGSPGARGTTQLVSGMAVAFAGLLGGNVAFSFFREHGWGTWPRLRCSGASTLELIIGLAIVPAGVIVVQQAILYLVGAVVFDLQVRGSPVAVALVLACFAACMVSFGLMLVGVARTLVQVDTFVNVGVPLLAGIGGALAPRELMPAWVRAIGPVTPHHWAMRGLRGALDGSATWGSTLTSCAVLLLFAGALLAVAAWRLDVSESKIRIS